MSVVSVFSLKFSGHFGEEDGSGTDWLSVSGFEFRALLEFSVIVWFVTSRSHLKI